MGNVFGIQVLRQPIQVLLMDADTEAVRRNLFPIKSPWNDYVCKLAVSKRLAPGSTV